MVLLFYIMFNLTVLFLFIIKKKNLHILEILVYWMVGSYLFQNFSALCYMNFKTLIIPDQLNIEFTHFLNRISLFPIVMLFFLHFYLSLHSYVKKFILLITFIFLFVGLEWLAEYLGVIIHVHWRIWWSYTYWLVALSALIGFMKFFRKILYKGRLNV